MCSSPLSSSDSDEQREWPSLHKAHLVPKKGTRHVSQSLNPPVLSLQAGVSDMSEALDEQLMQRAMQESAQQAVNVVQKQQYLELEQRLRDLVDGRGWSEPCSIFPVPGDGQCGYRSMSYLLCHHNGYRIQSKYIYTKLTSLNSFRRSFSLHSSSISSSFPQTLPSSSTPRKP